MQRYGGATVFTPQRSAAGPVAGGARRQRLCPDRHPRRGPRAAGNRSRRHRRPRRNPGRHPSAFSFAASSSPSGHIALPMEVRNATARLALTGEDSAGAVQLLDKGASQRSAGIVSETATSEAQPLLSDVYYLERALSPYAEIAKGNIAQLLDKHVSVLLLADVARIPGDDMAKVKDFVSQGRRADPLCRRSHHRRHRRSGAGAAAGRRALSGQRHGLVGAPASGAVRRPEPLQRAGSAGGSDGDAAGTGRARQRCAEQELGAAGRRHAADHRRSHWARAGS